MRSQYPAAQSRPQRPDWRVSLTTQERPRRPSSPGVDLSPAELDGRRPLLAPRGIPERGLQGPPSAGMAAPGSDSPRSWLMQGASWGCTPFAPTRRRRLSGPRQGCDGFACHECPCTQVHTRTPASAVPPVLPASAVSPSF